MIPKHWPIPQFDLETGAIVWVYPGNHKRVVTPPASIPDKYKAYAATLGTLARIYEVKS